MNINILRNRYWWGRSSGAFSTSGNLAVGQTRVPEWKQTLYFHSGTLSGPVAFKRKTVGDIAPAPSIPAFSGGSYFTLNDAVK